MGTVPWTNRGSLRENILVRFGVFWGETRIHVTRAPTGRARTTIPPILTSPISNNNLSSSSSSSNNSSSSRDKDSSINSNRLIGRNTNSNNNINPSQKAKYNISSSICSKDPPFHRLNRRVVFKHLDRAIIRHPCRIYITTKCNRSLSKVSSRGLYTKNIPLLPPN